MKTLVMVVGLWFLVVGAGACAQNGEDGKDGAPGQDMTEEEQTCAEQWVDCEYNNPPLVGFGCDMSEADVAQTVIQQGGYACNDTEGGTNSNAVCYILGEAERTATLAECGCDAWTQQIYTCVAKFWADMAECCVKPDVYESLDCWLAKYPNSDDPTTPAECWNEVSDSD